MSKRVSVDSEALKKMVDCVKTFALFYEMLQSAPPEIKEQIQANFNVDQLEINAQNAIVAFGSDVLPAKSISDLSAELSDCYKTIYELRGLIQKLHEWYKKTRSRAYLDDVDKVWDEAASSINPHHQPLVVPSKTVWDTLQEDL